MLAKLKKLLLLRLQQPLKQLLPLRQLLLLLQTQPLLQQTLLKLNKLSNSEPLGGNQKGMAQAMPFCFFMAAPVIRPTHPNRHTRKS
jgi:hypothetical protein